MSGIAYPPPTENLPIFDDSFFNVNQNVALTEAQANLLYLKFPTAQGAETFGDIFVNANATLNCPVQVNSNLLHLTGTASIQFPDNSIQTSAYTGTSGIANTVVVAPGGTGAMYLALTQGTSGNYPILTNTPQYNTSGVLSAPTFSGALNGNATTATTATQANNISISNTTANVNYFVPLVQNTTSGYKALLAGGSLNFNPNTNTLSVPNITTSSSVSSPFYTSPSGGSTRWFSTDNTQYGQIYSDNTYNLFINPAYKLSLTMNTQGASNPGSVNPTNKQGCDIGWNYNGNGSTDFYNNAGIQLTTTHQAFTFWDASTVLVQQAIAYIPRIQSAFSSTGLNIPTYDWVNGTISAGIGAITQVPITNTTSSINYFLPLITNTTTGNKTLFAGGSIAFNPAINTLSTTAFSASGTMTSPVLQTSNGGNVRVVDSTGLTSSTVSLANNVMIVSPNQTGNNTFFINTSGSPAVSVGTTPTTYGGSNTGLGITWNTVGGSGATDFVNYAQGAGVGLGGFNFFSGSTSNPITSIGFIPKVQSAFSAVSSILIPTYDWVNGTVSAAIGAIPSLTSFNMTLIPPSATNTYYGLWANSATTGSHPINNGSYVQLVPNTNTMTITSNLNILNTQTSLNNVRMTSTPIILCFGNCDGSASGGADATNLTSSYISSTGWTNPSGGLYELTLTGVSHSIFSATITGNAGTATAGQRPQILTSVAYTGGFPNAYLSVTFQIYYLQGTGGGGAPFNGPFSYSISGIMN